MRVRPSVALLLVFVVGFLVGCAASMHPGVKTVDRPSLQEKNEATWLRYWEDQFDADEGVVAAPSSSEFPDAAIKAYQQAYFDRANKVEAAKRNTTYLVAVGAVALLWGVIVLILVNAPSDPPAASSSGNTVIISCAGLSGTAFLDCKLEGGQ